MLLAPFSVNAKTIPGITQQEITFGQSAAFKGASASLGRELWRGSQAYFNYINSHGGVHGRKIKVISLDDGYEGNQTLLNTINLVKKKNVFALYGYVGTPTIVKALPVIQKFSNEGLVLFSNFTGAQPQRENPHKKYVFNVRSSYRQETEGLVDHLIKIGYKKIGVFIQYDAYGRSGADGVERALKKYHLNLVGEATYKRGSKYQESMLEQFNILKKQGVEAIISIGSYEACAAFIRDARMSGFHGPIANVSFVGAEPLLSLLQKTEKEKKVDLTYKLINSQVVPPWSDTSVPLVKEYQEVMDQYATNLPKHLSDNNTPSSKYGFISLEGFLNAKVLVEGLKKSPKNINRENFIQALESLTNVDVGLDKKVSFSKEKHQGLDVVYFTTVKDDMYVSIKDWSIFKK